MSEIIKIVQEGISSGSVPVISTLVAIFVVILTIVIFAFRGGSSKKRGVLLLGLCDSGKTLLFSRLVHNRYSSSHTSMKENSGAYITSGNQSLRILDLPGHERLRTKYLDEFKAQARAIVFVVDSLTLTKDIKEVGEYLYTVLTDRTISQNVSDVLVGCSKQDQGLAKGARLIQANIEKELNTLRKTRSAALDGTDNSGASGLTLGRGDKDFSFSDLKSTRVEFVECSARGNKEGSEGDIEGILQWLDKLA